MNTNNPSVMKAVSTDIKSPFHVEWFGNDREERAYAEDLEREFSRMPKEMVLSAFENALLVIEPDEGRDALHAQVQRFLC